MPRRLAALLLLLALLMPTLLAPAAARADTILSLSQDGAVTVDPDELDATLVATATTTSAKTAQARVNEAMTAALAAAKQASAQQTEPFGIATGDYSVWPQTSGQKGAPDQWQASQTLLVHGTDGPALLALVGALQQKGLVLRGLDWRMSDALETRTRAEALRRAVTALRAHADEMAGLLALRFVEFRTVSLNGNNPMPAAGYAVPAPPRAAAAPPPVAEKQPSTVTVTIQAEAVLTAK